MIVCLQVHFGSEARLSDGFGGAMKIWRWPLVLGPAHSLGNSLSRSYARPYK